MKKQFTLTTRMLMLSMCIMLFATCKKEMNVVSSGDQLLSSANKATTFTSNEKQPVDEMIFVPCADGGTGENVHLTGTIHILIHTTVNKNNFTTKYHFQPQGLSGTGETTGNKYEGSGVTQEEIKGSFKNGKSIDTYINNFNIVSHGTNYRIHVNTHITVNANGETTATVDNFTSDCK
jgi:hypothetical protein